MTSPKRIVLFVEGDADVTATPVLVKKLLTQLDAWQDVFLDQHPFKVGNIAEVTKGDGRDWLRFLGAAKKRSNLGGVLLLLDGDLERIRREVFCVGVFGKRLAEWSRQMGGGSQFSVAVVFALKEYESWLIACADRLAGHLLPDGRPGIQAGTVITEPNVELAPRDAKGWLDQRMDGGYKNTRDQEPLTQLMLDHFDLVRWRAPRSFGRLERAVAQLVQGITRGEHIVSPPSPT